MRNFTQLENKLMELGFKEIFGLGLWGIDVDGTMVDTNTGTYAKVSPHRNADAYDFVGYAEKPDEILPLIQRSETETYFIESRAEYAAMDNEECY
ncbi:MULTISPECIES: hypothetical protein [Vibrio]|uniref:hypothetical protein n=1 Tax=Vibrio TaxID=662 RepID=UPI00078BFF78|nr:MULTISPECIES: hypothetical protein [Vibrio]BAU70928.1 hypothetical protein [Vibrio sp. 04Ya108]BBM67815.1 hypothetical protein VA249_44610 [Vibrio alfacsensis]BCN26985.1 hypothetical protein VYA_41770 [Vibrio alfacsensis]